MAIIRAAVAPYTEDRFFAPDLAAATRLVEEGAFLDLVPGLLP
jgi:histidine ammonia-lyase